MQLVCALFFLFHNRRKGAGLISFGLFSVATVVVRDLRVERGISRIIGGADAKHLVTDIHGQDGNQRPEEPVLSGPSASPKKDTTDEPTEGSAGPLQDGVLPGGGIPGFDPSNEPNKALPRPYGQSMPDNDDTEPEIPTQPADISDEDADGLDVGQKISKAWDEYDTKVGQLPPSQGSFDDLNTPPPAAPAPPNAPAEPNGPTPRPAIGQDARSNHKKKPGGKSGNKGNGNGNGNGGAADEVEKGYWI